jgi:hypothetical protein
MRDDTAKPDEVDEIEEPSLKSCNEKHSNESPLASLRITPQVSCSFNQKE